MLGQGVYNISEVSRFTQMNHNRVRSWFKARPDGKGLGPVFQSDYNPVGKDYAVSFLDLIDVLIAGQFRIEHHLPMSVIRRAHSLLSKELKTKHPFCMSELHTDGKSIFRSVINKSGMEKLSEVISRQQFFLHVKECLDHIDYDSKSNLACRWRILKGVVLDPSISMGKPVIENTGLQTHIISSQYYANAENARLISDLYDITEDDVVNAVNFEERYGCHSHAA